jgi:lysosomal Pro-X carboxypeptidase
MGGSPEGYPRIEWYQSYLDHSTSNKSINMRYIIDDHFYKPGGPILFHCGNEASAWLFYNTSGFESYTLAKRYGGLSIFSEHRYFGKSVPFNWTAEEAHSKEHGQF